MSAEDGAVVEGIQNICPICGKERGKNCIQPTYPAVICFSSYTECKNKEGERRTGCEGYSRGNIGFSLMLRNNILTDKGWVNDTVLPEKYIRKKKNEGGEEVENYPLMRLNAYKKKIVKLYTETYFSAIDMETLEEETKNFTFKTSKTHPLGKAGRVQAHHLICNEAMKSLEWKKMVEIVGYNMDCVLNGVFLPSETTLACTARVPLHNRDHEDGLGRTSGKHSKKKSCNYTAAVKSQISEILDDAFDFNPCENSEADRKNFAKKIVNQLNKKSGLILEKIKSFSWTITWDGFDYMPGNPIGCGNAKSPKEKSSKKKDTPTEIQKKFTDQRTRRVTIHKIERDREVKIKEFHEMLENKDEYGSLCCKQARDHGKKKETLRITETNQYILKIGE